ncbi:hypothetical protein J6590_023659 [Homalodisca vitripennis]|nr:hypothetical protein J6590_023659 [Homalodisca vitripennis]
MLSLASVSNLVIHRRLVISRTIRVEQGWSTDGSTGPAGYGHNQGLYLFSCNGGRRCSSHPAAVERFRDPQGPPCSPLSGGRRRQDHPGGSRGLLPTSTVWHTARTLGRTTYHCCLDALPIVGGMVLRDMWKCSMVYPKKGKHFLTTIPNSPKENYSTKPQTQYIYTILNFSNIFLPKDIGFAINPAKLSEVAAIVMTSCPSGQLTAVDTRIPQVTVTVRYGKQRCLDRSQPRVSSLTRLSMSASYHPPAFPLLISCQQRCLKL